MNRPTPTPCPYGPALQVYWDMRYKLFTRFDQARVDATGLYTMIPEALALDMAGRACGKVALDVCSGIGAMSIALARCGQRVAAIEIDPERVAMARHNARVYSVSDCIDFRAADVTSPVTLRALPLDTDSVFIDPPWGRGPGDYLRKPVTHLEDLQLADTDLRSLVSAIPCREVMMRLPPNFDIGVFLETRGEKIAYVTEQGYLHWYFIRLPKKQFLGIPQKSAEGLSPEQTRRGFVAFCVRS